MTKSRMTKKTRTNRTPFGRYFYALFFLLVMVLFWGATLLTNTDPAEINRYMDVNTYILTDR